MSGFDEITQIAKSRISLKRLAYNLYRWLAGLSRSLGLLVAYGG